MKLNYTTLDNFHVTILVHLRKKDSFVLILAGMHRNVCKCDEISTLKPKRGILCQKIELVIQRLN